MSSIPREKPSDNGLETHAQVVPEMADTRDYSDTKWTARCKWFNRQSGWGFLVLTESAGDYEGDEIFVHYNTLQCTKDVFKYLTAGEYVSVQIGKTDDAKRPWQALFVTGIDGGILLCESRDEERTARKPGRSSSDGDLGSPVDGGGGARSTMRVTLPRQAVRPRGGGPRDGKSESVQNSDGTGWYVA